MSRAPSRAAAHAVHVPSTTAADGVLTLPKLSSAQLEAFAATLVRGPIELRGLRESLRSWLDLTAATARTRDSVVLATHEAAANAMVHGEPEGSVTVTATPDEGGGFMVEVTNHGGWKEPEPGHAGRVMAMMAVLMSDVTIRTNVRLRSG